MTTASEIIKNRHFLVSLAVHAVEHEARLQAESARRSSPPACATTDGSSTSIIHRRTLSASSSSRVGTKKSSSMIPKGGEGGGPRRRSEGQPSLGLSSKSQSSLTWSRTSSVTTPASRRTSQGKVSPVKFKQRPSLSNKLPEEGLSATTTGFLTTAAVSAQSGMSRREQVELANKTRPRFDFYASAGSKAVLLADVPHEPRKPVSRVTPKPSITRSTRTA